MDNNYVLYNGELYHYGVPGMKWGKRKQRKLANKYYRAGKAKGQMQYYKDQSAAIYKKHNDIATAFDKSAKKYESQGSYFKAEASRKVAAALRKRGENARAKSDAIAAKYEKKFTKLNEKASAYATKKRTDLGKKNVDKIMNYAKQKSYEKTQSRETRAREAELQEKMGDRGYAAYNKVRGK